MDKKGFIVSPQDVIKGLVIGFILGFLFIYLGHKGIIPIKLI